MATFYTQLLLICLFTCVFSLQEGVNQTSNRIDTTTTNDTVTKDNQASLNKCVIVWNDADSKGLFFNYLSDGANLMEFTLYFDNSNSTRDIFGLMFKPQEWSLTTGKHGSGLLMLQFNYEVLSMTILGVGVEKLAIPLRQSPPRCLWKMNPSDVEYQIRNFLINETARDTDHVCNMKIFKDGVQADLAYICCNRNPDGETVCNKLRTNQWIKVLLAIIVIIKVLVVLYSPLLVPDAWYRLKLMASEYVFRCKTPKKMTVFKTKNPKNYSNFKYSAKLSKFGEMPNFSKTVKNLKFDTPYCIKMRTANLKVKSHRLVPENYVPVSVRRSIYDSLFRCKIRNKTAVIACCESNIFGIRRPLHKPWPWYKFLRALMQGILFVFVAIPWIIRIAIFFYYEEDEVNAREMAAKSQNLSIPFPGNETLYLTPVHAVFLLVYAILIVDAILFGVLKKHVQNRFKSVLRKCFRDMRERSRFEIFGWAINNLLKPLHEWGLAGVVICIPFWAITLPVCIIVMAFYLFPTLNLTIRFVAHFVAYLVPEHTPCSRFLKKMWEMVDDKLNFKTILNKESLEHTAATSLKDRLLQLLVITICFISLYSIIFLLMECMSFFVEVGIYTIMGVILNSGKTMRFVTLLFLLIFHGNDCFKSVNQKYLDFNKVINEAICVKAGEKLKDTALLHEDVQKNSAFFVEAENDTDEEETVEFIVKDNVPKWRTNSLILFLDNQDAPYIPEKFFFDTCYLPHFGCPGALNLNLMRAMSHFMIIILFLFFVLAVVLAFGDVYQISATNQMMATLAGGFLPWIFTHFLFKPPASLSLDKTNLSFQNHFNRTIKDFQQSWPIFDIFSDEIRRIQKDIEMDIITSDVPNNGVDVTETAPMIGPEETPISKPRDSRDITDNKIDLMVIIPDDDKSGAEMKGSITMLTGSEIDLEQGNLEPVFERSPHIINV